MSRMLGADRLLALARAATSWSRGTQNRIAAGGFRFVVLQQGPSALPESRANLIEWTRRFDAVIRSQDRAGGGGRSAALAQPPGAYPERSATTGSTRVPRQAGAALATTATRTSAAVQPASVTGSSAPTP